jgi:hypothetical protein
MDRILNIGIRPSLLKVHKVVDLFGFFTYNPFHEQKRTAEINRLKVLLTDYTGGIILALVDSLYCRYIKYFFNSLLTVGRLNNDSEASKFIEHMSSHPNVSLVDEAYLSSKKYPQKSEFEESERLLWRLLGLIFKTNGEVLSFINIC